MLLRSACNNRQISNEINMNANEVCKITRKRLEYVYGNGLYFYSFLKSSTRHSNDRHHVCFSCSVGWDTSNVHILRTRIWRMCVCDTFTIFRVPLLTETPLWAQNRSRHEYKVKNSIIRDRKTEQLSREMSLTYAM